MKGAQYSSTETALPKGTYRRPVWDLATLRGLCRMVPGECAFINEHTWQRLSL
jgi:hypothetical protein